MEIADHLFHQLINASGGNQSLGILQRDRLDRIEIRRFPDEMGGALRSLILPGGLSDRLAEGDSDSAFVERADEPESDGGDSRAAAAWGEIEGMRHGWVMRLGKAQTAPSPGR